MEAKYLKIIGLCLPLFLTACGGSGEDKIEVPEEPKASLSISTTIQTRAVVTEFSSGDKMNLFVKNTNTVSSEDYKAGVYASYNGSSWSVSPDVEVQSDVYVFASYPYSSSADAQAVDVAINPQTDYLYSGSGVKVSGQSPNASLTMKHALPMIAFNVAKGGYTGAGKLTSIKVEGAGLYVTGTMNVANGEITGKEQGNYEIKEQKVVEPDGWTEDLPQMFCLPFKSDGSKINVTFTIDGEDLKVALPAQNVAGGMKYLFRMVLTQNGIVALAEQTEVISLNKDTDAMTGATINELGILFVGKEAVLPELTGKGKVSGTVTWGDGTQAAYAFPMSYSFKQDGEHEVRVQAIGATAVEFTDLSQVEEIDLSGF